MKKSSGFNVFIVICLVVQSVLMLLCLAYGFLGEYAANKPANIWASLWDTIKLGLLQIISNIVVLIVGIVGRVKSNGDPTKRMLSVLAIISFFAGLLCLIIAVGSHF